MATSKEIVGRHTRSLDWCIFTSVSVLPYPDLTAFVLVCLSVDWAGALVLLNSFSTGFVFRLVS